MYVTSFVVFKGDKNWAIYSWKVYVYNKLLDFEIYGNTILFRDFIIKDYYMVYFNNELKLIDYNIFINFM